MTLSAGRPAASARRMRSATSGRRRSNSFQAAASAASWRSGSGVRRLRSSLRSRMFMGVSLSYARFTPMLRHPGPLVNHATEPSGEGARRPAGPAADPARVNPSTGPSCGGARSRLARTGVTRSAPDAIAASPRRAPRDARRRGGHRRLQPAPGAGERRPGAGSTDGRGGGGGAPRRRGQGPLPAGRGGRRARGAAHAHGGVERLAQRPHLLAAERLRARRAARGRRLPRPLGPRRRAGARARRARHPPLRGSRQRGRAAGLPAGRHGAFPLPGLRAGAPGVSELVFVSRLSSVLVVLALATAGAAAAQDPGSVQEPRAAPNPPAPSAPSAAAPALPRVPPPDDLPRDRPLRAGFLV